MLAPGLITIEPGGGAASITVPLSATGVDVTPSELVNDRVPLSEPAVAPFNHTVKLTLCPTARANGMLKFDVVNWLLEILIWAIVRLPVPVFVTVALCETLCPTSTLPKLKLPGVTEKEDGVVGVVPPPWLEFAVTAPPHPVSISGGIVVAITNKMGQRRERNFLRSVLLPDFPNSGHRLLMQLIPRRF
jgi:hypothetical protein